MKLVEKLSFDAADTFCKCKEGEYCEAGTFQKGYEAGFRKALEFAQARYDALPVFPPEYNVAGFIKRIADEEVKE